MQIVEKAIDCPCWTSPIAKVVTGVVVQAPVGSIDTTVIPGVPVMLAVEGTR
jgi:hypothetical protein